LKFHQLEGMDNSDNEIGMLHKLWYDIIYQKDKK